MARRNSGNTISLFPFLAVLVCTMGALILLLLVTTRRIRNDQEVESAVVEAENEDQFDSPELPPLTAETTVWEAAPAEDFVISERSPATEAESPEFSIALLPPPRKSRSGLSQNREQTEVPPTFLSTE